jgi:hypothetical protein
LGPLVRLNSLFEIHVNTLLEIIEVMIGHSFFEYVSERSKFDSSSDRPVAHKGKEEVGEHGGERLDIRILMNQERDDISYFPGLVARLLELRIKEEGI